MYDKPKTDEEKELTREIIDLRKNAGLALLAFADRIESHLIEESHQTIWIEAKAMKEAGKFHLKLAEARRERLDK